ncbi:mediator of RNA polymerase II transcription subunit 15 isoform X2 [Oryzias melastigma]|uniref:mediator of RNA polymerase II transcription subunit 15 isoform X2 n=1 Tax=Oryzias melastigma TaxID=30732 RepID=UPI000CF833AF|nr:mediator of RNA polymerase II transcription subunit 15 isoform X2 [Oryzias melastigma]
MEVPGSDSDWRSTQFRQKVVAQIDDAMRKAGPGTTAHKSGTDMENQVYNKAKTRDEYLSLVARLIIHFRDIHKKSLGGPDPMNALTNPTGGGVGSGAIGMGPRPAGAQMGSMGAMGAMGQPGQHAMAGVPGNPQGIPAQAQMPMQQMMQQQQFQQFQQQQQQQQNAAAMQQLQHLRAQQHQNQQLQQQHQQLQLQNQQLQQQQQQHQNQQLQAQNQQQQQNQMHQVRMLQQLQHHPQAQPQSIHPMGQQVQVQPAPGPIPPHSQQLQQPNMVSSSLVGPMTSVPHVPTSLSQQQQQLKAFQARATMQQHHPQIVTQSQLSAAGAAPGQLGRPTMQNLTRPTRPVLNPPIPPNASAAPTSAVGGQAISAQVQHTMISSPSPVQVPTPQMPPPPQPSPQPPTSQPNSVSSGPTPSPGGGFQPSPSPQPSPNTATSSRPAQIYSVPSPGPLNTPGNPGSVMSPSMEDQQYMEKLKQLSKYIEPLRRMINKIDKNEDRKKDLSKMKSLLNILTDPNIRCPLKTLQKCEIALEKLKNDMAVPTPPPPPMATKQQYLCQPLLDAIITNIRSPVFNHSLYRTFAPAMSAIHGPPIVGPNVPGRKRKLEEDERQTVPNILQGEVARLDVRFLVNLDPSFCSNNGTVHLLCKLDDKNLPSVPPLQLSIPADYPDQSPLWSDDGEQYGANSFLQSVHQNMTSKLLQLPDKHSVTELLHTWAQSVRQACLSAA